MAVLGTNVSTVQGTTGVGWRKLDISEKINNLDPTDTPFFELTGKVPCAAREHSWQTRTLRTRAIHTQAEGADFTYRAVAPPSRVTNLTQILEDGVELSGSLAEEQAYGVSGKNIMRDQLDLRMVEHRNDVEYNLINASFSYGNTSTAVHQMNGLRASITTNATDALGVTLTETLFVQNLLQSSWKVSGVRPDTVLTGAHGQDTINQFSALGATKWIDTTTREITNQVLLYNSSYASVQVMLCRDLTDIAGTSGCELLAFNRQWNHKAWLRPTFMKKAADTADAERMVMISELTFQYDNEKSSSKWAGAPGY